MASNEALAVNDSSILTSASPIGQQSPVQRQNNPLPSSTPVEMSHLPSLRSADAAAASTAPIQDGPYNHQAQTDLVPQPARSQPAPPTTTNATAFVEPTSHTPQVPEPAALSEQVAPYGQQRSYPESSSAIGPSSDGPIVASTEPQIGPTVLITLLLLTGARHPYTIDQKYLRRRNVAASSENIDPFTISVYTLKELIWRDWREEWEPRPSSPSAIRLIHFGKLLDDKTSLKDCRFQPTTPNVVHMTVKPQEIVEEEENAKSGKALSGRERRSSDAGDAGCRCCIVQ